MPARSERRPREQYSELFPKDRKQPTLLEARLARESDIWFPNAAEPQAPDADGSLPYYFAGGKTAIGMNLDGKVGPNDFTSPEGEPGIDNQLFRAIGCVDGFRGPQGHWYFFDNFAVQRLPSTACCSKSPTSTI